MPIRLDKIDDRLRLERPWLVSGSLLVLAALAVGVALAYTRSVMIPFVIAVFITSVASPMVDWLGNRLRAPKVVAVVAVLAVILLGLAVFAALIIWATNALVYDVKANSSELAEKTRQAISQLNRWGVELDEAQIASMIRSESLSLAAQGATAIIRTLSITSLTAIFVGFLLFGRPMNYQAAGIFAEIDQHVRKYIATKFLVSVVTAVLVWVILSVLGLRLSAVFALLAFALNFIPSIGSIIATLLPIPMAIMQYDSIGMMMLVVLLPGAVQMTIGNVIEPKLYGEGLNLHPVTILLSLALWGLLWGPIGMFLAAPMTASLRIALIRFETTQAIGKLLAGEMPKDSRHLAEQSRLN